MIHRAVLGNEDGRNGSVNVNQDKYEEEEEDQPVDFMLAQAAIQKERQRVLEETCSRHPELKKGGLNHFTLRHLYVHEKHKMLYCFVPKVGCSNWKRVLMVLAGIKPETDGISSDEAHFKNGMKRLSGMSKEEQQFRLDTYTKFAFARHPFVRILSAYRNKYADINVYRKDKYFHIFSKRILKKYRTNATPEELRTGENITWHEWVQYLTDPKERSGFDDHWQEIYQMCSPCKIRYDYIGKLESVADDAKYMLTTLELDDKVSYPARANSHPTNSSQTYDRFFGDLTVDSLRKLWNVYSLDFELFGYPKPDFLS